MPGKIAGIALGIAIACFAALATADVSDRRSASHGRFTSSRGGVGPHARPAHQPQRGQPSGRPFKAAASSTSADTSSRRAPTPALTRGASTRRTVDNMAQRHRFAERRSARIPQMCTGQCFDMPTHRCDGGRATHSGCTTGLNSYCCGGAGVVVERAPCGPHSRCFKSDSPYSEICKGTASSMGCTDTGFQCCQGGDVGTNGSPIIGDAPADAVIVPADDDSNLNTQFGTNGSPILN